MQVVLIIDDDPDNLHVAVEHLEAFQLEVLTARDGATGVRRAREVAPDLILLDVTMPGIDGYEVCRRLKSSTQPVACPIIFMTASQDVDDRMRAFELGAVDYITKPFDARELTARVNLHLRLESLQQALERQNGELEARFAELSVQLTEHLQRAREAMGDGQASAHVDAALAILEAPRVTDAHTTPGDLSAREREVMRLLVRGMRNKEIATTLSLAPTSVSTYRSRIMVKLGVEDIPSLVRLAIEHGMAD